jgi:hypothetical protein
MGHMGAVAILIISFALCSLPFWFNSLTAVLPDQLT